MSIVLENFKRRAPILLLPVTLEPTDLEKILDIWYMNDCKQNKKMVIHG